MSMNAQAYDQYKKTAVETVAPGKLLLMLYDGAIKNLENAKKAISYKDIGRAHKEIIKAQDIIVELMSTLDMRYDIAGHLYSLYDYLHRRLVEANVKKDIDILNEVQGFMKELQDAWQQAVKKCNNTVAGKAAGAGNLNVTG